MSAPREGSASPWDLVQDAHTVAPGIVSVSTAGHGGYWLSPERLAEARARCPGLLSPTGFYPLGASPHWFEEDCEAARVPLMFPDVFPAESVQRAAEAVRAFAARGWDGWGAVARAVAP